MVTCRTWAAGNVIRQSSHRGCFGVDMVACETYVIEIKRALTSQL